MAIMGNMHKLTNTTTTHGTVELIVEKFSEFRVCFTYFEGGCICRYNDQFVINQIDRCCTDPITYPFKGGR